MEIPIGKIDNAQFFIDKAFRRGKTRINIVKVKDKNWDAAGKYKYLETIRLSIIKDAIYSDLNKIIAGMPEYNHLDEFYQNIFICILDVDKYKNALGSLKWAGEKISKLCNVIQKQIDKSRNVKEIVSLRNQFLARTSSFLKQIDGNLKILDNARRKIKEMPNIKTSVFTVAIVGFPNVGKSTLIGKITDSKPEINSYAFTTKGLMIGYIKNSQKKIQIIDTPGSLNRFEKMNNIEKMAHLCMKMIADVLIYVIDLTEPYPLADQEKLYDEIKSLDKPMLIYYSKADILDKKIINDYIKRHNPGRTDSDILKQDIIELFADYIKKNPVEHTKEISDEDNKKYLDEDDEEIPGEE